MRTQTVIILCFILLFGIPLRAQNWEQIGWKGGNIFGINAQIDDVLFASTQYAYYRSTDHGKTWVMIRDGLPMSTFVYENNPLPVHYNRVYISSYNLNQHPNIGGTGLYSIGKKETRWSYRDIKPIHGKKVLVPPYTLFYGNDSIITCSRKSNNEPDSVQGIFLSHNNGTTWERKMNGLPDSILELRMNDLEDRILLGVSHIDNGDTINKYYISKDKAETWTKLNNFPSINYPDYLRIVNNSLLFIPIWNYLNSSDSIITMYLSLNKGVIWDTISLTVHHDAKYLRAGRLYKFSSKMYLYVSGDIDSTGIENGDTVRYTITKSYLYTSTDNGKKWEYQIMSDSASFMSIVIGNDDLIMVGYQGQTSTTDTSFSTFELITNEGMMGASHRLLHVSNDTLFAFGGSYDDVTYDRYDSIYVSTDNGLNWTNHPFNPQLDIFEGKWVSSGGYLYTLGRDTSDYITGVIRSKDGGYTWDFVSRSPLISYTRFLEGDNNMLVIPRVYGFQDSLFFVSTDGGETWKGIPEPEGTYCYYSEYNSGLLFSKNEYQTDKYRLVFSTNFGEGWHERDLPSTEYASGPYILGKRWIIATSEPKSDYLSNMYYSDDMGEHWIRAYGTPPNIRMHDIMSEGGILYAIGNSVWSASDATGNSALYISLDSGRSWKKSPSEFLAADRLFLGRDYIFVEGGTELWRLPRTAASIGKNFTNNNGDISTYPNPSSNEMRIRFSLEKSGDVQITVFDMMGRQVAIPADKTFGSGQHEVLWDTRNIPSGSYLIELIASGERSTKVVTVLR